MNCLHTSTCDAKRRTLHAYLVTPNNPLDPGDTARQQASTPNVLIKNNLLLLLSVQKFAAAAAAAHS